MNFCSMHFFGRRSARFWLPAACLLVASLSAPAAAGTTVPPPTPPAASQSAVAPALTQSQRKAQVLLKDMADYLAGLSSFSVGILAGYDVVQANGQKIEFSERRKLTVERPARLRMEDLASDGKSDLILFDGRHMTVSDGDTGVFAQAPQPGTVYMPVAPP